MVRTFVEFFLTEIFRCYYVSTVILYLRIVYTTTRRRSNFFRREKNRPAEKNFVRRTFSPRRKKANTATTKRKEKLAKNFRRRTWPRRVRDPQTSAWRVDLSRDGPGTVPKNRAPRVETLNYTRSTHPIIADTQACRENSDSYFDSWELT